MTRPMGRIVAFAPEKMVGTDRRQISKKNGPIRDDVWWIHRDGSDCRVNEFQR